MIIARLLLSVAALCAALVAALVVMVLVSLTGAFPHHGDTYEIPDLALLGAWLPLWGLMLVGIWRMRL